MPSTKRPLTQGLKRETHFHEIFNPEPETPETASTKLHSGIKNLEIEG